MTDLSKEELRERVRRLEDHVLPQSPSATELPDPKLGDLYDLNGKQVYDLTKGFVPKAAIDPEAGQSYTYVQDTKPSDAVEGESWYDTGANEAYVFVDDSGTTTQVSVTQHGQLSGIASGDHHTRPSPGTGITEDANNNFNVEALGFTVSEASHSLGTGEYVALARFTMPTDTLEIRRESISNDAWNAPSGLNFLVRNATDAANEYTSSVTYNEGSPITTITGLNGDDILIALDNGNFTGGSGANQVVTGFGHIRVV